MILCCMDLQNLKLTQDFLRVANLALRFLGKRRPKVKLTNFKTKWRVKLCWFLHEVATVKRLKFDKMFWKNSSIGVFGSEMGFLTQVSLHEFATAERLNIALSNLRKWFWNKFFWGSFWPAIIFLLSGMFNSSLNKNSLSYLLSLV